MWRVTEIREGESFTWEVRSPGVHTVAHHRLSRNPDGTTEIELGLHQTGPLAGLVGLFTAAKTRRYLGLEAAGLKAAAEAVAAGAGTGAGSDVGTGSGVGTGSRTWYRFWSGYRWLRGRPGLVSGEPDATRVASPAREALLDRCLGYLVQGASAS